MKQLFILLLSGLFFLQCSTKEKEQTSKPANLDTTMVVTVHASSAGSHLSTTAIGIITNGQEAKPSFKTGGIVAATYFEEGDYVKKGQLMARLNLAEIEAQLQQASEALGKAERDKGRAERLYADSVATLEQVQNATTAVAVAKKTIEIIQFNKQYSEVRSPIDGRIVKQIVHAGEMAAPGMPVYAIIGTSGADWKIKAGFIDRDWVQLKPGQKATFTLDANPGKQYEVTLTEKAVIAGNASSLIDAEFSFKERPSDLAVGLLGKISINTHSNNYILSIPIECLTRSSDNTSYLYVNENGKARLRKIITGQLMEDRVEVLSGISAQDEIISTGAMYLEDGDVIKIKP